MDGENRKPEEPAGEEQKPEKEHRHTGADFVRKITPLGCAAFAALFVAVIAACFLAARPPISGYKAPHDAAYYAQSAETLSELKQELETNVFPQVKGVESCEISNGKLTVTIAEDTFAATRGKILYYYDESLFDFEKG